MLLTPDAISAALESLPGWALEDNALVRSYRLPSFPDAIAFVTRLAFDAEANDHHPDLSVSYRNVIVRWSTHSAGGVTEKDVEGARLTERIRANVAPDRT